MRPLPALFLLALVAAVFAAPAFRYTIALYAGVIAIIVVSLSWPSNASEVVKSFLVSLHGGGRPVTYRPPAARKKTRATIVRLAARLLRRAA